MTKEEIKAVLKDTQELLENEYGDIYYKYICEVFAEINEKLAFLDGLLTIIKGDLSNEQYLFLIDKLKKLVKELEKREKK